MSRFLSNARFAAVLAFAAILFAAGVVSGAAGSPLIIGAANSAGTSNTSLNTTSSGFAWQMFQQGSGVGVFAISNNGNALAALAHNGNKYGLSVTNDGTAGTGAAIIADGRDNNGIQVLTDDANGIEVDAQCAGLCAATGVFATGDSFGAGLWGVGGLTGVTGEALIGVLGRDTTTDGSGFGLQSDGDAYVDGNLEVTGACTGCTASALAVNESGGNLEAGTAVTAIGATIDENGSVLLRVRPAAPGDSVLGVVDAAMDGVEQDVSLEASVLTYKEAGTTAANGGVVRVITSGIAAFPASSGELTVGGQLSVASAAGDLASAPSDAPSIGTMLGSLKDGRVVILVGGN